MADIAARQEEVESAAETTATQLGVTLMTHRATREEQIRSTGEAKGAQLCVAASTYGAARQEKAVINDHCQGGDDLIQ